MNRKVVIVATAIALVFLLVFGGSTVRKAVDKTVKKVYGPEIALKETIDDTKAFGIDGLKNHLTSNAKKKIDSIESWSDKPKLSEKLSSLSQGTVARFLKSKASEVEWSLEDTLKGEEQTIFVIGFKYKENLEGTVEVLMKLEDEEWKIDKFQNIEVDKLSLW